MAEKKTAEKAGPEPVTLTRDGLEVATSLPREIVQLKAAGWSVKGTGKQAPPEADSAQDTDQKTTSAKGAVKK